MSGVKHTPVTPYTTGHLYFDDPTWDQKIVLRGRKTVYGQAYVVAHVNQPESARAGDDKRYARLFCAAPDLLEAGEGLLAAYRAAIQLTENTVLDGVLKHPASWSSIMEAALARARGEQSPNHSDQKEVGNG